VIPWYIRHADKLLIAAVLIAICGGLVLFGRGCAKQETVRAEVKAYEKAAERTEKSVQISADTQKRVDTEGADTRKRTAQAVEKVDAVIQASPVAPSAADADLLRLAREAHQRAIAAHCRVQRESDCANPSSASE
jgi:hypothetical protein